MVVKFQRNTFTKPMCNISPPSNCCMTNGAGIYKNLGISNIKRTRTRTYGWEQAGSLSIQRTLPTPTFIQHSGTHVSVSVSWLEPPAVLNMAGRCWSHRNACCPRLHWQPPAGAMAQWGLRWAGPPRAGMGNAARKALLRQDEHIDVRRTGPSDSPKTPPETASEPKLRSKTLCGLPPPQWSCGSTGASPRPGGSSAASRRARG